MDTLRAKRTSAMTCPVISIAHAPPRHLFRAVTVRTCPALGLTCGAALCRWRGPAKRLPGAAEAAAAEAMDVEDENSLEAAQAAAEREGGGAHLAPQVHSCAWGCSMPGSVLTRMQS